MTKHGSRGNGKRAEPMREALRVTKALSDIQRLRILMMLRAGELCVCQIVEVLGLAPSTVSKHLSILSAADLVLSRRDGRWAYFRLPDPAPDDPARPWVHWLADTLRGDRTIREDAMKRKSASPADPEDLCRDRRPRPHQRRSRQTMRGGLLPGRPMRKARPGGLCGVATEGVPAERRGRKGP